MRANMKDVTVPLRMRAVSAANSAESLRVRKWWRSRVGAVMPPAEDDDLPFVHQRTYERGTVEVNSHYSANADKFEGEEQGG